MVAIVIYRQNCKLVTYRNLIDIVLVPDSVQHKEGMPP
jgi:hypothetical protein